MRNPNAGKAKNNTAILYFIIILGSGYVRSELLSNFQQERVGSLARSHEFRSVLIRYSDAEQPR